MVANFFNPMSSGFLGLGRDIPDEYKQVDPEGQLAGESGMATGLADALSGSQFTSRQQQAGQADLASRLASQSAANQAAARGRQISLADALARRARGEGLYSDEMLRQAQERQMSGMRSMAASAAPQNAAMAARTAMIQGGRAMSGLAGQQALAGIRERQLAENALGAHLQGMRGQDLRGALMGRQQALAGYGDIRGQDLYGALQSRQQALGGYGALEQSRAQRYSSLAGQPTGMQSALGAALGGLQVYQMGGSSGGGGGVPAPSLGTGRNRLLDPEY